MPSLIYFMPDNPYSSYVYVVPPAVYPDGHCYIKIGGDSEVSHTMTELQAMIDWFHCAGGEVSKREFTRILQELLPGVKFSSWQTKPCLITDTVTERPYIGLVEQDIFVGTGGCGAAAKSADEIGRLAALSLTGREFDQSYPADVFKVVFQDHSTDDTVHSDRKFHF